MNCLQKVPQCVSCHWIVHVEHLNNLITEVICISCAGTGLKIYIDLQNQGFSSSLVQSV